MKRERERERERESERRGEAQATWPRNVLQAGVAFSKGERAQGCLQALLNARRGKMLELRGRDRGQKLITRGARGPGNRVLWDRPETVYRATTKREGKRHFHQAGEFHFIKLGPSNLSAIKVTFRARSLRARYPRFFARDCVV